MTSAEKNIKKNSKSKTHFSGDYTLNLVYLNSSNIQVMYKNRVENRLFFILFLNIYSFIMAGSNPLKLMI